jgi:hypothetical protein
MFAGSPKFSALALSALALMGLALLPHAALAGGADGGGGGKGVLCNGKLRILDVYEAEEIHHLHVPQGALEEKAALEKYWAKLINYFQESSSDFPMLWDYAPGSNARLPARWQMEQLVDKRMLDLPEGEHLPLSQDATLPKLKPGCKIVQILELDIPHLGPFDNDWQGPNVKIKRDLTYWNMLDGENKALLRLHELTYNVQGIKNKARPNANSDDIRRLLGLVASDKTPAPMGTVIGEQPERHFGCRDGHHVAPPSSDIQCRAAPAGFDRTKGEHVDQEAFKYKAVAETRNGQAGVGLYFTTESGVRKVAETSAFIPGMTLKQFSRQAFQNKPVRILTTAKGVVTDELFNVEIHFGYGAKDFPYMTEQDKQWEHPISIRAWHKGEKPPPFSFGECESFLEEDVDPYPRSCRPGDVNEPSRAAVEGPEEESRSPEAGNRSQAEEPAR